VTGASSGAPSDAHQNDLPHRRSHALRAAPRTAAQNVGHQADSTDAERHGRVGPRGTHFPIRHLNVRCHLVPHAGPDQLTAPPGLTRREVPSIEAAPVWPAESTSVLRNGHSVLMFAVPADSLGDAVEAARSVLAGLVDVSEAVVLHASNNVVVGAGAYVAKATCDEFVAEREYLLSDRATQMGAPTLPPVMPPMAVGDFTVLVWPRAEPCDEVFPRDAARALVQIQQAWRDFEVELPRLTDRFDAAKLLISSGALDRVLDPSSSDRLEDAVLEGIQLVSDTRAVEVLHGGSA